jgi:hypothetical protein
MKNPDEVADREHAGDEDERPLPPAWEEGGAIQG